MQIYMQGLQVLLLLVLIYIFQSVFLEIWLVRSVLIAINYK